MRSGACPIAIDRVRLITAPLDAQYAGCNEEPTKPTDEAMWMMAPPPALRMMGTTCFEQRNMLFTLIANVLSQSCSDNFSTPPSMAVPALLKRTWIILKFFATFSTVAETSAARVTSQWQ